VYAVTSRQQGYVLGINADGLAALSECVPGAAALVERSTALTGFILTDERLRSLMSFSATGGSLVHRGALHDALAAGLDIERGVRVDQVLVDASGGVECTLHGCDDRLTADIVVGADGANSAVRPSVCPGLRREDTGVVGIAAWLPLERVRTRVPQLLAVGGDRLMRVLGPGACSWLVMVVSARDGGAAGDGGAASDGEDAGDRRVLWVFNHAVAVEGTYDPESKDPQAWLDFALERAQRPGIHPDLAALVQATHAGDMVQPPKPVFSMDPGEVAAADYQPACLQDRVVLLGDAAHTMTTHMGLGANTALVDAAALARHIRTIASAWAASSATFPHTDDSVRTILADELKTYNTAMRKRGATAVRGSLQRTREMHCATGITARNWFMWGIGWILMAVERGLWVWSWIRGGNQQRPHSVPATT